MTSTDSLMDKLWNASYAITAFALAQGLAYLYGLAQPDFVKAVIPKYELILNAILWCHIAYVALVVACHASIHWACEIPITTKFGAVNAAICTIQVVALVLIGLLANFATKALAGVGHAT